MLASVGAYATWIVHRKRKGKLRSLLRSKFLIIIIIYISNDKYYRFTFLVLVPVSTMFKQDRGSVLFEHR
jgi:hypothetical protein